MSRQNQNAQRTSSPVETATSSATKWSTHINYGFSGSGSFSGSSDSRWGQIPNRFCAQQQALSSSPSMTTVQMSPSPELKVLAGKKKKASFECSSCTRKFATRSHLVRHSRVHTGERRYACDYPGCEMRCSRKDNLQQQ